MGLGYFVELQKLVKAVEKIAELLAKIEANTAPPAPMYHWTEKR